MPEKETHQNAHQGPVWVEAELWKIPPLCNTFFLNWLYLPHQAKEQFANTEMKKNICYKTNLMKALLQHMISEQ